MPGETVQDTQGVHKTKGASGPALAVGTRVYVRTRFVGKWTDGFEVKEVLDNGYRLLRRSDGYAFPDVFPFEDVDLDRRRDPLRGINGSYLDRRH